MLRLQELVDKLQLKVKGYKRQAEEAVSVFLIRSKPRSEKTFIVTFEDVYEWVVWRPTGDAGQHSSD